MAEAYIRNHAPIAGLSNTPYEQFFGHKPCVAHLLVFGSCVYVRVPSEKRSKLGHCSRVGMFVGYQGSHYLALTEDSRHVEQVRNVVFDESEGGVHEYNHAGDEVQQQYFSSLVPEGPTLPLIIRVFVDTYCTI
jgi:hypothetical protein